jgi:hypothetical protein
MYLPIRRYLQINSSQGVDVRPEIYRAACSLSAADFVGTSEADKGGDVPSHSMGAPHSGSQVVA